MTTSISHAETITSWLRQLVDPEGVVELRALEVDTGYRPCIMSGFFDFDHLGEMAAEALRLTPKAKGCYFTLNPLHRDLLARRANRVVKVGAGEGASDAHVLWRRWVYIDVDPTRMAGISSTDAEKAAALDVARAVKIHFADQGWPEPVFADSGNGFHLLYKTKLPRDDGGLVERAIKHLAKIFNSDKVTIDTSVFNASRICRLYGTWARKGDSIPERPHRRATVLEGLDDV